MKKKVYIAPVTNIVAVNVEQMFLVPLSGPGTSNDAADSLFGQDTKGSGDWDIWGNGSDSDYDDDYDY